MQCIYNSFFRYFFFPGSDYCTMLAPEQLKLRARLCTALDPCDACEGVRFNDIKKDLD